MNIQNDTHNGGGKSIVNQIDTFLIERIRGGSEKAFSELFNAYYSYLNTVAMYYLLDKEACAEIVDDVFMNVWHKRESLSFPIHYYLVRSVQNGCLNYIRSRKALQNALDEHKERILAFQENYIQSTPLPLQEVELRQAEEEIRRAVDQLPPKCKAIFEEYFYAGKSADMIADSMGLSISTIRVQLKNATDRLRPALKHLLFLISLFN